MKKAILFAITYLMISMFNGYCKTMPFMYSASIKSNENNKIDLSGNFPDTRTRSVLGPILLIQYTECFDAVFNNDLGIVTIQIIDKTNIVYQSSINTSMSKQISINIDDFISGEYSIKFIQSDGRYMQGVFTIR
jgi:hypothetical protein